MPTTGELLDHYETLQISKNADTDTVQRVFRMLAQRYHPDNQETGNVEQFRQIHEAYLVLNDPEQRAKYDIRHETFRQERWKFVANGAPDDNDFSMEQHTRYVVLEILYSRRRAEPDRPALSQRELVELTGRPREHLEFTIWYLSQRKMVMRDDQSSLIITADGVDYVEQGTQVKQHRLRLVEHR
jgi:curved DNA-binding protein